MLFWILFVLFWLPIKICYPVKKIGKNNLPKKKGYVLTCNHYSNLDCVMLDVNLNKKIRFLAKKELFENKFFGWILRKFGAFPVNREKPEVSSFKFALNTLKNKKILGIFPEGTRNKNLEDNSLQEVKTGAIIFAAKGDAPIVPVVLYKRSKIFRKNYLLIGEPIEIEAVDKRRMTHEEIEANAKRLVDAMNKLRTDMDEKIQAKKEKKNARKK